MAGPNRTKFRLLYLRDFLLNRTDENHPVTVAEMLAYMESVGVPCERKTLYNDLEILKEYGLDLVSVRDSKTRYYVGMRDFELTEVKLLADAVQSSKFITNKKTIALADKLTTLVSQHEAQAIRRQLLIHNRAKTMNESVYYTVDILSQAIAEDHAIQFKYFKYTVRKEKEYRHNGMVYEASPFALLWDDENYYMLAYDHKTGIIKHFRADKMAEITLLSTARRGKDVFRNYDLSSYSSRVFSMFGGEEMKLVIRFPNALIDPVIDRFGQDVVIIPEEQGTFTVHVRLEVSPQFYAWIFGLGKGVAILSPPEAVEGMKKQLQEVAAAYGPDS